MESKLGDWQATSWRTVLELGQTGDVRDAALDRFLAKYRRPLRAYAAALCARKFSYAVNLEPDDVVDSFISYGIQQSLFEKVKPPERAGRIAADSPAHPKPFGRFRDWLKTCFFQFMCAEARLDTRLQRARIQQTPKDVSANEGESTDGETGSPNSAGAQRPAQYRAFVTTDELQIAELRSADDEFEKSRAREMWESAERLFHLTYSSQWQYGSFADSQRGVTIHERVKMYAKTKSQIETASLQMITAFRTLLIGEIQKEYGRAPTDLELKEELDGLFQAAREGKWALTFTPVSAANG